MTIQTAQDVDYLAAVVYGDAPELDRDGTPRFLSEREVLDPETLWTTEAIDDYWREEAREAAWHACFGPCCNY